MQCAAGTATGRDVSAVGEDAALAGLGLTWADGGYYGFSASGGIWPAVTRAGQVLTGATPGERDWKIRAHWQETR